jgi:uncharacterized cupin superfamily protein
VARYTLVNREDPSVETFRGAFRKMRRALGTTAFGLNELTLPAGVSGLEHNERDTGHEEVYAIVEGGGTVTIDGEDVAVTRGDYLRVDAECTRKVTAGPDGIRFIAVGAKPRREYDGRETL